MFFLQYILPNLISIFSVVIAAILGFFTYKLDKTTKATDNEIKKQKLEIEKLKEEINLNLTKALLLAIETISKKAETPNPNEIKKSEEKLENIININKKKKKNENSWIELKKFLNKKK